MWLSENQQKKPRHIDCTTSPQRDIPLGVCGVSDKARQCVVIMKGSLKTESSHDANFVVSMVSGGTGAMKTYGATNDDKCWCHGDSRRSVYILAATKQLSMSGPVRLSVCLSSVSLPVSSYHHEIFRSNCHWQKWCQFKMSSSEVKWQGHRGWKSTILTRIKRFRTVTPVWIHRGLRNDAQRLKGHRRGALYFPRSSVKF